MEIKRLFEPSFVVEIVKRENSYLKSLEFSLKEKIDSLSQSI